MSGERGASTAGLQTEEKGRGGNTGHVFVRLSGEIRDRKHLGEEGGTGEGDEAVLFVRVLYSIGPARGIFQVSLVYGVARGKTNAFSDLRDVMPLATSHPLT